MKIPYSSEELRFAFLSAMVKIIKNKDVDIETKMKEIGNELTGFPEERKDLNKKIAEFNGIGVEKLIDSPNYKVLCEQYEAHSFRQYVKKLVEKFEFTDKEAWATVLYCLGLLN